MENEKQIRNELTEAQQKQIAEASAEEPEVLELFVQELEERILPGFGTSPGFRI